MEMEMATIKCMKQAKDKQMTRKKKKVNWFGKLSDDILKEILKKLPDDFLRYKAKYVCKQWFSIVTDGILLDHASFILQIGHDSTVRHVDITEEQQGLQVKEQTLEIPLNGWILSWCNEYLLISDLEKHEYVFNVLTKEASFLPHCASCGEDMFSYCRTALSFDGFKGVYKIVHVFMGPPMQCHILTLRRSVVSRLTAKWKKIEVPFYTDEMGCYWADPISVQARYFHWNVRGDRPYLVSVDMVKEKVFRISLPMPMPMPILGPTLRYTVFEMGGFLTLIHHVSFKQIDMWILRDVEMMKWEKLQCTIPDWWYFGQYLGSSSDIVLGVKKNMRYLTCMSNSSWDGGITSYDLKDKRVKELNIHIGGHDRRVVHSSTPSFI